jgi:hypothetical protein
LQGISVIKVILRRKVVFFAFVDDFVIVCVHVFNLSEILKKSSYFLTIFFCHTQGSILWNLTS